MNGDMHFGCTVAQVQVALSKLGLYVVTKAEKDALEELQAEQLKPCPFCGGKPELCDCVSWDGRLGFYVRCNDCHVESGRYTGAGSDRQDVTEAWNKRAGGT